MRALLLIAASAAVAVVAARAAHACTPIGHEIVFFESGSAHISRQALTTLKNVVRLAQDKAQKQLPVSCERLTVTGQADTAEATTPQIRIDILRAEAVRDALVHEGVPKDLMLIEGAMGAKYLVPTPPNVREPQNRVVEIWWEKGAGRLRCDPATKNKGPGNTCSTEYLECYWELTDGTICNFWNAPDPNPAKYSVIKEMQ